MKNNDTSSLRPRGVILGYALLVIRHISFSFAYYYNSFENKLQPFFLAISISNFGLRQTAVFWGLSHIRYSLYCPSLFPFFPNNLEKMLCFCFGCSGSVDSVIVEWSASCF